VPAEEAEEVHEDQLEAETDQQMAHTETPQPMTNLLTKANSVK
jgi:hypothetical protein